MAPRPIRGEATVPPRLVRRSAAVTHGICRRAEAELHFLESPREELHELAPRRILDTAVGHVGLTIDWVNAAD